MASEKLLCNEEKIEEFPRGRHWSASSKAKDLKKKEHRKMAKKSRRQNRRAEDGK